MDTSRHTEPAAADAYVTVSTALSINGKDGVVSTRTALRVIRRLSPACGQTDEELIALIVAIASGRTMGVSFDHRD